VKPLLILALALGILGTPQFARAQSCNTSSTIYWTGTAGDNLWTTKGNWNTNQVPGLSDNVCINPSFSVTAGGAEIDINSLNLLGTLTVTNSAGMNLHSTAITSTLTNLTVGTNSALYITGSAMFPGSVTLASGGTIAGNNSLNSGTATFTGAVMVTANSALTVPTITNQGSITITQPSVQFTLGDGGTINNAAGGAINILADGVTINASGSFNNTGTFSYSGSTAGTSNLNMSGISPFNNTGTVVAQGGTLVLNLSQSVENPSTGAFNANASAVLRFATGEIVLNAGTKFGGGGTLDITSAVWSVSAPTTVSTANLIFDGSSNNVVLGSSTLTLGSTQTTWNSGILAMSGADAKVTLSAGKTMLITTSNYHGLNNNLDIMGTVNQTTALLADDLYLSGATVTIEYGAKFNLQADGGVHGNGTISDLGTFAKTQGTGVSNVDYSGTFTIATNPFPPEGGTVVVNAGTLNFANSSGGTFTGVSTVDSNATLQFSTGTYQMADGTEFTGPGTTLISSVGSWGLQPGNSGISIDTGVFQVDGAAGSSVLQSIGDLNVNSKEFNFTGGNLSGSGTVTIPAGVTLTISTGPVYILGQRVNNSGTAQISGTAQLYLGNGATWANVTTGSKFIFEANGSIRDGGGGATFNNNGKVQKTGGAGSSYVQFTGTFNNNAGGSFTVDAGSLFLEPSSGTSAGAFSAANKSSELYFEGQWAIKAGTTMTGMGEIVLQTGAWNLGADLTVSAIFTMGQAAVNGSSNFTLTGPSISLIGGIRMGALDKNGKPTGTIIIGNETSHPQVTVFRGAFTIDACTMENSGSMTIGGGGETLDSVTIQDGAIFVNELGSTITLASSSFPMAPAIVNNSTFTNYGTITQSTAYFADSEQSIGGTYPFDNYGKITIPNGKNEELYTAAGYNEHGTTTVGGNTLSNGGEVFIKSGLLKGPGTVSGTAGVDNAGTIQAGPGGTAPGSRELTPSSSTVGILNLSVPLTIESSGTVVALLNGTKAGTLYDQIISTSSVALGGTLNLQFGNGFSPSPSDSFAILSFASSTGGFATVVTPSSTCAGKLTTTSVSLSVAFTSSSVAVAISPATVTLAETTQQQFTGTVTNGCGNGVTWTVKEGATGGEISTTGLYTAPATAGTFHVVVTSVADPTQSATATVTVTAAAGKNLSVTPQAAVVRPGGGVHFSASQSVTWSVAEGATGGSISATGTYTAARTPGVYHVVAVSTADTTSHTVVNIAVVGETLKSAYVANLEQNSVSVLTANNPRVSATGPMRETQSISTGHSPAGLAISPQGLLLSANRDSNDVSAFAVSASDATLQPAAEPVLDAGTGPGAVAWDPSGHLAFVIDAGSDDVSLFSASTSSGLLSYLGKQALETGDQPSAVAVHPSAPFVFIADAGANNVHGFTYDMAGMLKPMSGSPFAAGTEPAAAVTEPTGKFLFVANRVSGDVSVFAIDEANETLHRVSGSPFPVGKTPAAVVIDVTGSYFFVADHQSNSIATFRINSETGALTPLSQTLLPIEGPTALAADPSGRYLFVVNDSTGGVLNVTLDVATGTLASAGLTTGPGKASAIVLAGARDEQAP